MPTKLLETIWGGSMTHHNQSNYVGSPSFSIPDGYLKVALNLLNMGVGCLKQRNFVKHVCKSQENRKTKTLENTITIELVGEMQKEQENYNIRADVFSCNLVHPITNIKYSQIDIRFTWDNYSPMAYLAVEAKLLFGKGDSLAGKYVEEGVMDFVNGKYSFGHSHGIMVGYILLKPIDNAISDVEKALKKRRTKTNEISPIDKVQGCFNYSQMYNSTHTQKVTDGKIILYHMFVDLAS